MASRHYYFALEAEGFFPPLQMVAAATFGGGTCTEEELAASTQELRMIEELPLAWVGVHVPWNASDPYLSAQKAAARMLGLKMTVPMLEESAVAAPLPEKSRGAQDCAGSRW